MNHPKHYHRLKLIRYHGYLMDVDGNLNLMCASKRGLRLLARLVQRKQQRTQEEARGG